MPLVINLSFYFLRIKRIEEILAVFNPTEDFSLPQFLIILYIIIILWVVYILIVVHKLEENLQLGFLLSLKN